MQLAILTVDNANLALSIHTQEDKQFKQVAYLPYSGDQYEYCKEWLQKHGYTFHATLDVAKVSQWIYSK